MSIESLTEQELEQNTGRIIELLGFIDRPGMTKVVKDMIERDYFEAPASTRFHGNFTGGLAAHSLAIYDHYKQRVKEYDLDVPEESIRICALLHDYCKVDFYQPNILENGKQGKTPYKVVDELPIGHGEKSVMKLLRLGLELTDQEMMIIRWHMGPYEGEPWKMNENKIKEQYPEALAFHHVDNEVSTYLGL